MKQWIGMVVGVLFGGSAFAAAVDAEKAKAVAFAFAEQNAILAAHTEGVGEARSWQNVWVVALKPSGYVVVEKEDLRPPVIAFAKEDFPETPAPAMATLLERPAVEAGATTFSVLSVPAAHEEWGLLLESASKVAPLSAEEEPPTTEDVAIWEIEDFTYAWDQVFPYNLYAPGLSRARIPAPEGEARDALYMGVLTEYGMRSACGCVATAFAQVAAWFRWPYALRGVSACEHEAMQTGAGGIYATHQVAAPGEPYDWWALDAARVPSVEDEDDGEEVGRFMQHWATLLNMAYYDEGTGGTSATEARPDLLLLAGYKVVSPEGSSGRMVPDEEQEGVWMPTEETTEYTDAELEALYGAFFDAIYTYGVPAATGIPGHYIVCDGWAQEVDKALSAETRYVKLNYGWGPKGNMNGWYALRDKLDSGDGESVAEDGKIFLQECFTILPLQCGEIVQLSKKDVVPTELKWYEAPYWRENYRNARRCLQVVNFTEGAAVSKLLSLEAAAKCDANWIYTPTTANPSEFTGSLTMDPTRAGLKTAVLFPDVMKRGAETLKITVDLTRLTYPAPDGTTPTVPDEQARSLVLALEDVESGTFFYTKELSLKGTAPGPCEVSITAEEDPYETVFRVLLLAGCSPDDDQLRTIPVDSLAYAVTGVKVEGCAPSEKTTYDFVAPVLTEGEYAGALTRGTLPEAAVAALAKCAGEQVWLAVTIETDSTLLTHDALWKPLTIVTDEEDPVALPTVAFKQSRLFLNDLATPIEFTMTCEGLERVTAYLSQASWLNEASREGFELSEAELTDEDEDGVFTFTLSTRANTDPLAPDAMTLTSAETVGRDAVLSLCVTDEVGNEAWTHVRLTWGYSDEVVALAEAQELVTYYLDQLLFAAIYAGCYTETEPGGYILAPKSDSETKKTSPKAAMAAVADAIRLGYAKALASGQETAIAQRLLRELLLDTAAFCPRVEVLTVSPDAITFRLCDNTTASEMLAQYVDASAITLKGGATPDEMEALDDSDIYLTCDDETGIYTLYLFSEDKNFFHIKL